ncbi:MAG: small multidrug resistance family (SMR) protein, partial [uncultured Thermomicrobiales bacterium]
GLDLPDLRGIAGNCLRARPQIQRGVHAALAEPCLRRRGDRQLLPAQHGATDPAGGGRLRRLDRHRRGGDGDHRHGLAGGVARCAKTPLAAAAGVRDHRPAVHQRTL